MKRKFLFALILVFIVSIFAISASAEVSVTYTLEETTDSNTGAVAMYQIVATLVDTEADFRAFEQNITFDNNIIVPVSKKTGKTAAISTSTALQTPLDTYAYTYYDENTEEDVTVTATYPSDGVLWTANGATSTLETKVYVVPNNYPANGVMVFELHFVLADGYTIDDFTADTFRIDYIKYTTNEFHYYGNADASLNDITIDTSSFIPKAAVITVPVVAGDIVYLQDGTFATAETTGDYTVLNDVGYVAVNTGKTSQKTYYIDGSTATEVHLNGVVGSDDLSLRAIGADDVDENNKNRSGLRFKMLHNPNTREGEDHAVTEVGFLMTAMVDSVVNALGEKPVLTMEMNTANEKLVKKGLAFSTVSGENKAFDQTNDDLWIISGVFYGVPLTTKNVQTKIISRPYYEIGDEVIYGEQTESTLYDTAYAIKNGGSFDTLTQYQQDYINEIIGLVDTEIVEDEVIIDITDLYVGL